jgi:F420-dependent oxidoreductase-like protein
MNIGLMIGSDRERSRTDRLPGLVEDVKAADDSGFRSIWIPQVPGYLDALTTISVLGQATRQIELGTAVVPIQTRHPLAMAQQALTTQAVCGGRLTLGLGPSHHWVVEDQFGLPYERPAALVRDYLEVLNAAFAGPGEVNVDNATFRVHSPINVIDATAMPVLIAALAPLMLRIAGEQASGTILWMADERAIGEHVAPRIATAAEAAGRPAPRIVAGVPVALCPPDQVDAARTYASDVLGHADLSPNYERLLEHGDAGDVGDTMAAGDEAAIVARLKRYRDAGVTDLGARVVPIGDDPSSRGESRRRTQAFLASLCPEL